MKKLLLGISMFFGGIFGMCGLMIAHACKVSDGISYKDVTELIFDRGDDAMLFVLFALLAVFGLAVGYISTKGKD